MAREPDARSANHQPEGGREVKGSKKAKAPLQRGVLQTNKSVRTLTVPNVPAVDETVKQTLMIASPEALRAAKAASALYRNTACEFFLGYQVLRGYGLRFDTWSGEDGRVIAFCGESLHRIGGRLRLDLSDLVRELKRRAT